MTINYSMVPKGSGTRLRADHRRMGKRMVRKACSVYKYMLAEAANADPKQAARLRERARRHRLRCEVCGGKLKVYQKPKAPAD